MVDDESAVVDEVSEMGEEPTAPKKRKAKKAKKVVVKAKKAKKVGVKAPKKVSNGKAKPKPARKVAKSKAGRKKVTLSDAVMRAEDMTSRVKKLIADVDKFELAIEDSKESYRQALGTLVNETGMRTFEHPERGVPMTVMARGELWFWRPKPVGKTPGTR